MDFKADVQYISVSCNRTPGCLDWGKNNKICYGACNSVVICDPEYNNICYNTKTLYKHTGRVNCVRWLEGATTEFEEFVSGSCDQTAIVWQLNGNSINHTFILKGHNGSINAVDGLYKKDLTTTYVVTASVDSTVKIWKRNDSADFTLLNDLKFNTARCLSIKLVEMPSSGCVLLAIGLDNDKIYIYCEQEVDKTINFVKVEELIGHEDWIRGLDFTIDTSGDIFLASSSQDTYIRLWKIFKRSENYSENNQYDELVQESRIFQIHSMLSHEVLNYSAVLESVLSGHENWVYGTHWHQQNEMQLLSSSMDKTMIIWKYDSNMGIWLESVRVGEVGGNSLGFYGGKFSPDGKSIIGHGYQGSLHLWKLCEETNSWLPSTTVGGHYDEVIDISWEPSGKYLLSTSCDQTTRLHAEWKRKGSEILTWHEMGRPQVHGYDMSCVASLSCYHFASAAEEKIIRLFQATHNFVENFRNLTSISHDPDGDIILQTSSKGASVPSLGLSNKAVYDDKEEVEEKHVKDMYPENYFVSLALQEPPTEDNLMQNTLWPEVQKLYGHGYEIYCIACSIDNKIIASACKANNTEHASIILWNATTGELIQKLPSHQLTVTQLEFSPNNQYLLSVSRDRRWTIFQRSNDDLFHSIATTNKQNGIHSRIIWCCCWTSDSEYFLTGSREGKVVMWGKQPETKTDSTLGPFSSIGSPINIADSVTAIAVAPKLLPNGNYLLAIGTESGKIHLYDCSICKLKMESLCVNLSIMDERLAHHLTVKRLRFRPNSNDCLASCGSDHVIKIYSFNIK